MTNRFVKRLFYSQRGSVAVILGITAPILLGMVALGTEITFVIYKHRQMQSAADSAALSGAAALVSGHPTLSVEGDGVAGTLGFVNGVANTTVTLNNPPLSGSHVGNAAAIEAIVSQPQTLKIVSFFTTTAFNVSARAVALKGSSGSYCILETDTAASSSVSLSNGATVNLNQCSLAVNASGSSALTVTGGATLTALSVSVVGQTSVNGGGSINTTKGLNINQAAVADPYANVAMPTSAGCANTGKSVGYSSSVTTLSAGTYCNGLSIANGANVFLSPGVYYIKSGTFSVAGGATVNGTGVTIVLTTNGSGYANVSITNGTTVNLNAPTTGATAGILFFSDRNAPTTGANTFAGGTTEVLTGALYFPTQTVNYSDGASNSATCTQLIAWQVTFTGGANFNSDCASTGVSSIGGGASSQLTE